MKNHIVKIDFDSNILEVRHGNYLYSEKGETFKIISRGPTILAEVTLRNGQLIQGEFIVDTGSNNSLTLNSSYTYTSFIKELIGDYKGYNTYDMCGNIHNEYEGKAQNLTIGSAQTNQIPITLSIASSGVLANEKYAGLIGTPVLRCFTVVIDLMNKIINLEPNEALKDFSKNTKH